MITVKNLSKSFGGKNLFSDLSFHVEEGEFVALVGPSGSGKSTILNMIGLLEPIEKGQVFLKGKLIPSVRSRSAVRYRRNIINYLFQNNALITSATVEDNLWLAMRYKEGSSTEKFDQIKEVLSLLGIEDKRTSKVYELSGGEQQRVAMARTVLKPGDVILADEPTGSLDPEMSQKTFDLLRSLRDRYGKTILLVTHNMELARQCDRMLHIESL